MYLLKGLPGNSRTEGVRKKYGVIKEEGGAIKEHSRTKNNFYDTGTSTDSQK